ncbi:MAG: insulinase family protein [Holosporaceae bacterium]|nr:insulinase family protein [Holosporaceae bacterium]
MSNRLKSFFLIAGILAVIFACVFPNRGRPALVVVYVPNALGIRASLVNIDHGEVLYVKCKFKNAGVLHNSSDKHGISAVLSSLMFRKMHELSPEESLEKMAELGMAHFDPSAFGDDFAVSFFVLKDEITKALKFLSPAFSRPNFTKNDLEFAKENFPLIPDIDSSHPRELLLEKLMSMLYANHPYGLNCTGTAQAIASITAEDIDKFVQSKFTGDNLEVIFAGNVSAMEVSKYLNILFAELPRHNVDALPGQKQKIDIPMSSEKISIINNPNARDLVGVAVGVRLDELTDLERAALYVLLEIFYNHKTGILTEGLRSRNISNELGHFLLKRSLSDVFYTSVFLEKKDLANYLKYLEEKTSLSAGELDPERVEKAKDYLFQRSLNEFVDLTDIDETSKIRSLPFRDVSLENIAAVAKKLWDKSKTRTVIIGNEIPILDYKEHR